MYNLPFIIFGAVLITAGVIVAALVLGMQLSQRTQLARLLSYSDSIERYCQALTDDVQRMEHESGLWDNGDDIMSPDSFQRMDHMMDKLPRRHRSAHEIEEFIKDIGSERPWTETDDYEDQEDDEDDSNM